MGNRETKITIETLIGDFEDLRHRIDEIAASGGRVVGVIPRQSKKSRATEYFEIVIELPNDDDVPPRH